MANVEEQVRRLERLAVVDRVSEAVRPAVDRLVGRGPQQDLLTGRWLSHPVHPAVVLAPLGCWFSATVLDLVGGRSGRRSAQRLTALGIVAAVPAAATGAADWLDTRGAEQRVGTAHAGLNGVAVWLFARSWGRRRRGAHLTGVAYSLAGLAVSGASGFLGGHLAYRRGVGVDTTAFLGGPDEWETVASLADLADGDATACGTAEGVPLLVHRSGDRVRVLGDRCTHRGGPLHEGPVEGDCVTCPWHDSVFDLDTGAVVRGPASVPQPRFDVRVVDGDVQVRFDDPGTLRRNVVTAAVGC